AEFGIFVDVGAGVEGLLHASELEGEGKPKDRMKEISVGDEIQCMVTNIDMNERKLSLSVRAMHKAEERENIRHYTQTTRQESRTSFGDLLGEKLKQLQSKDKPEEADEAAGAESHAPQEAKSDDS